MDNSCLTIGTHLKSSKCWYTVIKVLGQGGFGITYLVEAQTMVNNAPATKYLALKEHFISSLCSRDPRSQRVISSQPVSNEVARSLRAFIVEAQRLKTLGIQHPNIVKVEDVFEENGTAYYAMEYLNGGSLAQYVQTNGRLTFNQMAALLKPVCNSVALLHLNKVAHYDIKPENIMLVRQDNTYRAVLIDFGLSKHYDGQGNATSSIAAAGYTPGYAPVEQYGGFSTFQPTADVYGLGATMLFCLTGHRPARAQEIRLENVRNELTSLNLSTEHINSILSAIEYRAEDRPANAAMLAASVFNDYTYYKAQMAQGGVAQGRSTVPRGTSGQKATIPERIGQKKNGWLVPVLVLCCTAVLAFVIFNIFKKDEEEVTADQVTVEEVAEESVPAAEEAPAEPKMTRQEALKLFTGGFTIKSQGLMDSGINYVYEMELDPINSSCTWEDMGIYDSKGYCGTMMQGYEAWNVYNFSLHNSYKYAILDMREVKTMLPPEDGLTRTCKVRLELDEFNNLKMTFIEGNDAPGPLYDGHGGYTKVATFYRD